MKATTVRIEENMLARVDSLARSLHRPRSWVINQAIEKFVDYEEWFIREVEAGVQEVGQGQVATDEEVAKAFGKWGVDAR